MYTETYKDREFMANIKENNKMQQITIKLKGDDINRLWEYADKKCGNSVSNYITQSFLEAINSIIV